MSAKFRLLVHLRFSEVMNWKVNTNREAELAGEDVFGHFHLHHLDGQSRISLHNFGVYVLSH